jgi:hypothetical protein
VTVFVRRLFSGALSLSLAAVGGAAVAASLPDAPSGRPAVPSAHASAQARPSLTVPVPAVPPAASRVPPPRPGLRQPRQRAAARPDAYSRFGFDISWPQCRASGPVLPPALGPVAIVGVNGGRPFSSNPCLRAEWAWARSRSTASGYLNLAAPPGAGAPVDYGAAAARDGLARASSTGIRLRSVWLDVEVSNHWSADAGVNRQVIGGAISALQAAGVAVGIYSTPLDWRRITHGATVTVPLWQALPDGRKIAQGCAGAGFGGRAPDLVQAVFSAPDGHQVDGDLICTSRPDLRRLLG